MTGPGKTLPEYIRYPLVLGTICLLSGGMLGYVYSLTKPGIDKSRARKLRDAFARIVPGFDSFVDSSVDGGTFYKVKDGTGKVVAFAAKTSGRGSYNTMEPIQLITVMDVDLQQILGVRVVQSSETPGLGERIKARPAKNSILGTISSRPDRRVVRLADGRRIVAPVMKADTSGVTVLDGTGSVFHENAEVLDEPFAPTFQAQFAGVSPDELALARDGGPIDALTGATVSSTAVLNAVKDGIALITANASK
ncbi:MAG: FMN-binding protein [Planctomycetes bacterium]|nr:FMN-binding protein [Planctomycetota bacterium]